MTPPVTDTQAHRSAKVYDSLRDLIVLGLLAPGTRVLETEIASRFDVSRTPVRSALHRLQQEGYIVELNSGTRARLSVAPLTKEDGLEVLDIVGEIEGLAGRYAAQLDAEPRGRLTAELRALNADLRRAGAAEKPDSSLFFELDSAFHRRYVHASGGRRVIALHDAIKPQADRYIRLYTSVLVDSILTSVGEHDAIIAAIEGGSPDAAQRAVQTNWRDAAQRLSAAIERIGEWGSW